MGTVKLGIELAESKVESYRKANAFRIKIIISDLFGAMLRILPH